MCGLLFFVLFYLVIDFTLSNLLPKRAIIYCLCLVFVSSQLTMCRWISVGSDLKFDARRDLDDVGATIVEGKCAVGSFLLRHVDDIILNWFSHVLRCNSLVLGFKHFRMFCPFHILFVCNLWKNLTCIILSKYTE